MQQSHFHPKMRTGALAVLIRQEDIVIKVRLVFRLIQQLFDCAIALIGPAIIVAMSDNLGVNSNDTNFLLELQPNYKVGLQDLTPEIERN